MKKIILSLFIGLFSVISLSAQGGLIGGSLTWNLLDGELMIQGIGDMPDYGSNNQPWYPHREQIRKVVVGEGVTTVGQYAFPYLSKLEEVVFPSTLKNIKAYVFYYSGMKKKVTIPASVTSIHYNTFYYCDALTEIEVHKDNATYSSADGVLYNKKKTELLEYPYAKKDVTFEIPSGVTAIKQYAGYRTPNLKNLIIPASVSSVEAYAFYHLNQTITGTVGGNVIMKGSTPPAVNSSTFPYKGSMQLTVPTGARNSYMGTSVWNGFQPVVEAGSEYITPNLSSLNFEAKGQTLNIRITSNIRWQAVSSASWLKISTSENQGALTVSMNVTADVNPEGHERTATITFTGIGLKNKVTVKITQGEATLTVLPQTITISSARQTPATSIIANRPWQATIPPVATSWLSFQSSNTGSANGAITFLAPDNSTGVERSAVVVIAAGNVKKTYTLIQRGKTAATLTVSPSKLDFAAVASTETLTIKSNTTWSAEVNPEAQAWLSFEGNDAGTGDGSLKVKALVNKGEARSATVTVIAGSKTQTIKINQASSAPTLEVTPANLKYTAAGATQTLTVKASGAWTAAISSGATWLSFDGASNATGNGSVKVKAAANTFASSRDASIVFTSGSLKKTITVTQAAAAVSLVVTPETIEYTAGGSTETITVKSNAAWTASISSGATWLSFVGAANASGNGSLKLKAAANSSTNPRNATLTVAVGSVKKTVVLKQLGKPSGLASLQSEGVDVLALPGGMSIILPQDMKVEVYDLLGTLHYAAQLSAGKHHVELPVGIYILRVGKAAGKVAIQ